MGKPQKIKKWYKEGLWTRQQVLDAIGKWLTEEEAEEILSTDEE